MIKYIKNTSLILAVTLLLYTLSAFQTHAVSKPPDSTPGGLFYFKSQLLFEGSFFGLAKEDFEESPVADNNSIQFPEPLDSSTNIPGVFLPGDIVDNLILQTAEGTIPDTALSVVGKGFIGVTSVVVGTNWVSDTLDIIFLGNNVYAVGMDLMLANSGGKATLTIYGECGTILDTLTEVPIDDVATFFGIYSPHNHITRISVNAVGLYEFVDNIQFGGLASTPLTFYTSQATFESAHPGLPKEDFEKSAIADHFAAKIPEPLNSDSLNPYFAPGDILDGLSIKTLSTSDSTTSLTTIGGSVATTNNSSKIIATSYPQDNLLLSFPGQNAYAVGLDLMFVASSDTAAISVYNIFAEFLGVTWVYVSSSHETFFGVHSNDLIGYIVVHNNDDLEFVDNIQFGGSPTGLTFYNTEGAFRGARSKLFKEDFSKGGPVADNTSTLCVEPIDSTTNQPGCFEPGDILPNITFQTEDSLGAFCPGCMVLYGKDTTLGNTTPMLGVDTADRLEITFSDTRVHYAGMSMFSFNFVSIYGVDNSLLGTATSSPGAPVLDFWGVKSAEPISRITIYGGPPKLNEILFGDKFSWLLFLPAILGTTQSPAP